MQPPPKVNQYEFPSELFVPKGVITLSPKALAVAKQFVVELGRYDPKARWIAGFQWCRARSMRWTAESETFDEGPGIDLAGFRYGELPTDTVEVVDGVPVIFLIPPDLVAAAKTITMVETRTNSGRASFALESPGTHCIRVARNPRAHPLPRRASVFDGPCGRGGEGEPVATMAA